MKISKPAYKQGQVSLRISKETLIKLNKLAAEANVSVSEVIRQIVDNALL